MAPEENEPVETQEIPDAELCTYQVKYVDSLGETITELIEATHVVSDEDFVELWDDDVLMLMVQRSAMLSIRNVTRLDMEDLTNE